MKIAQSVPLQIAQSVPLQIAQSVPLQSAQSAQSVPLQSAQSVHVPLLSVQPEVVEEMREQLQPEELPETA